jgi:tetratricopeptide (TPR) repeat protein
MATTKRSFVLIFVLFLAASSFGATKPSRKILVQHFPITTRSGLAREIFDRAMVDFENERRAAALSLWRQAARHDANFALAHLWISSLTTDPAEESSERNKAKASAVRVSAPEQLMIRWLTGVQENDYVGGIAAMNDLLARYPRDKRLNFLAGRWAMGEHQYETAENFLKQALDVDPAYPPALNYIAYAYAHTGDFSTAYDAMNRYTRALPREPNPQDSYAEILRMAGQFEAALKRYRAALKLDPRFSASQVGLADTYTLMGNQEQARVEYAKAVAMAPGIGDKADFLLRSAMTYVRERKFEDADKAFMRAIEHAHAQSLALWEARGHRMMAMYAPRDEVAMKHLGEAAAALQTGVNISQSDLLEERARILRVRAGRLAGSGNFDEAKKTVVELDNMMNSTRSAGVRRAYHAAAGTLLCAQQKYAEAILHLEEDYYDPLSMKLLYVAYRESGNLPDAEATRKRLLALKIPSLEQALVVPEVQTQEQARARNSN